MKVKIMNRFDREDLVRMVILGLIASVLGIAGAYHPEWFGSSGYNVVAFAVSIILILTMVVHLVRRILFPALSLNVLLKDIVASNDRMAKAVVFSTLVIFMGMIFVVGALIIG